MKHVILTATAIAYALEWPLKKLLGLFGANHRFFGEPVGAVARNNKIAVGFHRRALTYSRIDAAAIFCVALFDTLLRPAEREDALRRLRIHFQKIVVDENEVRLWMRIDITDHTVSFHADPQFSVPCIHLGEATKALLDSAEKLAAMETRKRVTFRNVAFPTEATAKSTRPAARS